ncbi:hypothetical protein O6H91_06G078100 [Diphasiastrum complanatum]|uniref:Uncharacterized protein n=1 Tax=Diphasiastrum complanatum TaxID=34168 RepID=A0ACC2DFB6_DIPCM|nr:hypothetical protein O6H91_06G078100 [Diphasiastrum complanatum]
MIESLGFHSNKMRIDKQLQALFHQSSISPKTKRVASWELNPATEMVSCEMVSCEIEPVGYTSLRDVIFTEMENSHSQQSHVLCEVACSGSPRTPIKNHLVEQAARAYVQAAMVDCEHGRQEDRYQKFQYCMPIVSVLRRCFKLCSSVFSFLQEMNRVQKLQNRLNRVSQKCHSQPKKKLSMESLSF